VMSDHFSSDLFGVYVHWPFCKSKCPYCDFNSHVADTIDHEQWREAYIREIDYTASLTKGRQVTSVFFGGGTPSLMEPKTVERVLNNITRQWSISDNVEVTLEANPTSVETQKFKDFKAAGINRVSIGVQSLKDRDLEFLGRRHNADEAVAALKIADKIFDRFSFDLIYARPYQSTDQWHAELKEALNFAKGHLSLYQLTIEPGTPFYMQHARGDFSVPQGELAADLYEVTQTVMEDARLPAYEVSNHAQEGQESLHNLTYWRYREYAGIGPGAHGRLTLGAEKKATRTHRAPDIWLSNTQEKGHGYHPFETVDRKARLAECLMMGLRLREGVSLTQIETETAMDARDALDFQKIKALVDEGLLLLSGTHIKPTMAGLQCLNSVLRFLL